MYPVRGQTGGDLYQVSDTKVEQQIQVEKNSQSGFVPKKKQVSSQEQITQQKVQNDDPIKTYNIVMDERTEESTATVQQTTAPQAETQPTTEKPVQDKASESASITSRGNNKLSDGKQNNDAITKNDLELLARLIYAEARGEDFEGQVAVGAVVLNRLKDAHFPKTIQDVVFQPGAFTAVVDKQIHLIPDEEAYRAAEAALSGKDPSGGALYYFNPKIATDRWIKSRPVIKQIGNHTFSI
ncbi:cell wall hydrolase [Desulfitobacterium sp. Sab5]|uniref:cell wall hydrolase n=1 Tax=Desulfitobacterium nosdiversum TaxID=3375356 RepID=UPI003CFA5952